MIKTHCLDENGNILNNLTQWDIGQKLRVHFDDYTLSSAPKVHFTNRSRNEALVVNSTLSSNTITADIPNELLREPYNLYAYIYLTISGGSRTIVFVEVPVRKRVKPQDVAYSDDIEILYLDELTAEINQLISTVNAMNLDTKISSINTLLATYDIATKAEVQEYIEG